MRRAIASTDGARVLSLVVVLAVWWAVSALARNPRLAPDPWRVLSYMATNLWTPDEFGKPGVFHLAVTLLRLGAGLAIAFVISLPLAIGMAASRFAERVFSPWVAVGLSIPTLVWAMLAIMWFGVSDRAVVLAVAFTVLPFVAVNLWEGAKAADRDLLEMARVYRANTWQYIFDFYLPFLAPFVIGALRYGFSLGWKIVVIAEHFGVSNGAGFMLDYWYHEYEVTELLAWTLTFAVVVLGVDYLIGRLRIRSSRWRLAAVSAA